MPSGRRRQRAHERAVIDGSADGIAVLDGAGLVRQWNPAAHQLTGVAADDAMGKPPPFPQPEPGAKLTHRLPGGRWLDVLCTALASSGERVIDFRDVTAAGIGIGLYIVRRLAVAQDGQVDAASREGGGTVMRVVLRDAVAGRAAGDARADY